MPRGLAANSSSRRRSSATCYPQTLPDPFPVQGLNVPARTVSGDFFDFISIADGRIGFCLGDVSGKGINAAMLMAKTASLYRCMV